MTEITYHDVNEETLEEGNFVAVDREELDAVVEKAQRADDLDERLDEMNSTLESLSKDTEILNEVGEEELQALRDREDPIVKEREDYEAKMKLVDEVGKVFAEALEEAGSPFDADELAERFTPLELKAKYEELLDDDESFADSLSGSDPEPEGGDATEEELETDPEEEQAEVSEEQARAYVAADLEERGWHTQAEQVREGKISLDEFDIDY